MREIDAANIDYKTLNEKLYRLALNGEREIYLKNVNGQRFIAAGFRFKDLRLEIDGTPGNDLGVFMDGPTIIVYGNAADGVGNTMNKGRIIIHGDARDLAGHSMRGGVVFVKNNVGYRTGLHMKQYKNSFPVIVVGGGARDFLGEYMAGGILIILGLNAEDDRVVGDWAGTGMHGGVIYVRGYVRIEDLGYGAKLSTFTKDDLSLIRPVLKEYCGCLEIDLDDVTEKDFVKIVPKSYRPYQRLYTLKT